MPGEKRLGAAVFELNGATFEAKVAEAPGLLPHWIDEVYPRPSPV